MLSLMQSWTSAKKHWSCFDILKDQGPSKSHLKRPFYKIGISSVRSEGDLFLRLMGEVPTWHTTALPWRYLKLRSVRSSCKQSKAVFPHAVSLRSSYLLLKRNQRTTCCSCRSKRIRSKIAQQSASLARTQAEEETRRLGLERALRITELNELRPVKYGPY